MAPDFPSICIMSGEEMRSIRKKLLRLSQAAMARQLGYADTKRVRKYEEAEVVPEPIADRVISLANRRMQEVQQKRSQVTQLLEYCDTPYAS